MDDLDGHISPHGERQTAAIIRFGSVYCFAAPRAPALHELQMPNPLALPTMLAQRPTMLLASLSLNVAVVNGVSVVASPAAGVAWRVVPHAAKPAPKPEGVAAVLVQLLAPGLVASSFTVTEVGITPVRVLVVRSRFTPRLTTSGLVCYDINKGTGPVTLNRHFHPNENTKQTHELPEAP